MEAPGSGNDAGHFENELRRLDGDPWFLVTFSRGMENFARDEIRQKLYATEFISRKGKLFFRVPPAGLLHLGDLRSVERVFVALSLCTRPQLPETTSALPFTLRTFITSEFVPFEKAYDLWKSIGSISKEDSPPAAIEAPAEKFPFRISCKLGDEWERAYHYTEIGRTVGGGISRRMGWEVSLEHYDIEVSVHLNREYFVIAFPLRGGSLARRSYLHSPSLRSTTAWALSSLAKITEGDIVLDPMCGSGTTLIEGLMEANMSKLSASFIAADLNTDQIRLCKENVSHAKLEHQIQILQMDARRMCLSRESVDAIICDVPFGSNELYLPLSSSSTSSSYSLLQELYWGVFLEFHRVLRKANGRAVILTDQEDIMFQYLEENKSFWSLQRKCFVMLGSRPAHFYVMKPQQPKKRKEKKEKKEKREKKARKRPAPEEKDTQMN